MRRTALSMAVFGLLVLSAIPLCMSASPSRPPDLSGTWNADLAKSTFVAGAARPEKWILTIKQDGDKLVRTESFIGADGKSSGSTMTFTTDGKENRNDLEGAALVTKCRWEGQSLLIEGYMELGPTDKAIWSEKLTLMRNGRGLHATSSVKFPGGQSNDTDVTYTRAD